MSGRLGLRKKKGRKPAKIMTPHRLNLLYLPQSSTTNLCALRCILSFRGRCPNTRVPARPAAQRTITTSMLHPFSLFYHHHVGIFPRCHPLEWDSVPGWDSIRAHLMPSEVGVEVGGPQAMLRYPGIADRLRPPCGARVADHPGLSCKS